MQAAETFAAALQVGGPLFGAIAFADSRLAVKTLWALVFLYPPLPRRPGKKSVLKGAAKL